MIKILNDYFFIFSFVINITFFSVMKLTNKFNFLVKNKRKILSFSLFAVFILISSNIIINLFTLRFKANDLRLTDFCPWIAFLSTSIFFLNKEKFYKKRIKIFMPWIIFASTLTTFFAPPSPLVLSLPTDAEIPPYDNWDITTHFFGDLYHAIMFFCGLFMFLVFEFQYTKKEIRKVYIIPAIFIIWVVLFALIPWLATGDKEWAIYSTALLKPATGPGVSDNYKSAYYFLDSIAPYPIPTIIFYILAFILIYVIIILKNKKEKIKLFFKKNKTNHKASQK